MNMTLVEVMKNGYLYRDIFTVTAIHWAPVHARNAGQVEMQLFGAEQSLLSLEEKVPFVPPPPQHAHTRTHTHAYTALLLTKTYPSSLISKS